MKRSLLWMVAVLLVANLSFAQDKTALQYSKTISAEEMKSKLTILASDEFEGRETGKEGQKKAAAFLKEHYQKLGLKGPVDGDYFQKFAMYQTDWSDTYIRTKKGKMKNGKDFIFMGSARMSKEVKSPVVFVGAGTAADLEKVEVKGKSVVVTDSENDVIRRVKEAGAKAVFAIVGTDDEFNNRLPRFARFLLKSRMRFEKDKAGEESITFYVPDSFAANLFAVSNEDLKNAVTNPAGIGEKTVKFMVKGNDVTINTENVMAYLEGTDLKEEVLVVSSHYDHIGVSPNGEINNGADDDGSGTVGVMELAEAFVQAAKEGHRPRRSILFLNVTGEEKGLLGSEYYSNHPVFPVENTVNNLNIDMIGRIDPEHDTPEKRDYIYVIGSEKLSSHLKIISEYANITYTGLMLDYKFDDPKDPHRFYYRSDHYNFAKHGIPVIFYFNGTHADYHRSTDTVDKIEFELMEKRAQLVFHTAWILANRNDRTPVDRKDDMDYTSR